MADRLYRSWKIDRARIDKNKRTVEMSFASETPVERWDGNEILSHENGDFDFSRIDDGAHPLLLGHDEHDPSSQIGVIESARVDSDKVSRCLARFGNSAKAQEVFQDVCEGIRQYTSVGYDWTGIVNQTKSDDGKMTTRYRWRPTHVAIVPVPADTKSGVGRSQITVKDNFMQIDTNKEIAAHADTLVKDFPHCRDEILTLKARALCGELEFQQYRMDLLQVCGSKARPKQFSVAGGTELGLSRREIHSYSFREAFLSMCDNKGKPTGCFAAEVSQQCERNTKTSSEGLMVPMDIMLGGSRRDYHNKRDMNVGVFGSGGALVATDLETPVIEVLRNRTYCLRRATVLAGLSSNITIPRQTSTVTPYSLPESGLVTASNLSLDQIALVPHRVSAQVIFSRQLLIQSSADIEGLVRDDSMKTMGVKIDWLSLNGGTGADEPTGIVNQPGIGSITFGSAPTWPQILTFEASLGSVNADRGRMAYMVNSNTRYVWKQIAKTLIGTTLVAATPAWENPGNIMPGDDEVRGIVNGYDALATNQLNGQVVFGNFMDLVIGFFGGLDIIFDPYTKAANAQNVFTINSFIDINLRHPQSFCVSTDSGAQ
jgi:hypothetical protein